MVPPNNLGPDLNGKAVNETQYRDIKQILRNPTLLLLREFSRPKRKSTSAMSSTEAEYVAAAGCCTNILWMKSQLTDYDIIYQKVEVSDGSNLSIFRRKNRWDDQIPNKDAIILYYLANGVEVDFARLIWEDIIHKLKKKTKEKIVPYPWFISILLEYMMPEYKNDELTLNPTQVFSVHNWALKPNQPKGPPFTDHMLAICNAYVPMEFKAPKTSSQAEKKVS
ncbi:hypothetical protein Tco_0734369 [Tanacetum coccineum]